MKIKLNIKKSMALLILMLFTAGIILGTFSTFVYATNNTNKLKIEKISNPESGEGKADGIVPGGDRETSYAWAMTTRGDYVYVGTNKNIIGNVAKTIVDSLVAAGATEEMAWGVVNMATDGEIPRPTTTVGGEIFKCNIETGKITKIFTADYDVAFRMAIEFEGNLYFGSYSGDVTADNYIYKIDENDNVTVSFTSSNGTSMRAACIYDNSLFFGGVDAREELDTGDENCVKLGIMKKDASDDTKWERVADYKDFREYAEDEAIKNNVTSPIWDICSYDGYIYATIPNSLGIVMYKGHPAEGNEPANEYGWYWTEIIGKNSKVNNIGLAETAEGQIGDNAGLITMAATPFVFKDKLYLMNFDNTIQAELQALTGLLARISGQEVDVGDYIKPMYTTLNNPQKLWCYDDTTGKFKEVENFKQYMANTSNEYLWRTEIYNDELYITTMDSAVLYNWALQFTGGDFTTLTGEEIDEAIVAIEELIAKIEKLGISNAQITEMIELLRQAKVMIAEFKTVLNESEKFNNFVVKYEELIAKMEVLAETIISEGSNALIAGLEDFCSKVDWDGLRMYAYIVRIVENDVWGFDLLKTSDGVNFEVVTDSGFGDKYNYGGRSLIATDAGLYVGTANPFFGAQLWRVSADTEDEGTGDEGTGDEGTGDEGTGDEGTGGEGTGDEGTGGGGTGDESDTGISKEEYEELKEALDKLIKDQEKFKEELEKLKEELDSIKNSVNKENSSSAGVKENASDSTTATGKLPQAGNTKILITITYIALICVGIITRIKYKKYRDIN